MLSQAQSTELNSQYSGRSAVAILNANVFFLQVEHIAMVHNGLQLGVAGRIFLVTEKMLNLFGT